MMNTATKQLAFGRETLLLMVAFVAAALLIWYTLYVFLLAFAGILLAIFLHGLATFTCRHTGLSRGWSLLVVVSALVTLFAAAIMFLAPSVATQVDNLIESLPRALELLRQTIVGFEWGQALLTNLPEVNDVLPSDGQTLSTATNYLSSTVQSITSLVIVLFVGLFLAAEPNTYLAGIHHLIPLDKRERATEVIEQIGSNLQWWLIGKVGEMIFIGLLTWAVLWFLGVPLSLTLGIIAALLVFIPNIGPIIAVIPAVLLALLESPMTALYVIMFFTTIQTLESYLLTPIVQKEVVSLPPALTIMVQVLMAVIAGGIGLVLATPLLVVVFTAVRMLYVKDFLGDHTLSRNE